MNSIRVYGLIIKRFLWIISVMGTVLLANPCISATPKLPAGSAIPFAPGERLTYQLKWSLIPAGHAILEVLPMKTINGSQAYHFRLTAKSNAFVDIFFKVRDRIDAFANVAMTHTVRYLHKQREGHRRKDVQVDFDWNNESAQYSDGKKKKKIGIKPGTFDPLSVFYYSRMVDFPKDGFIQRSVTDGKKCVSGQARIIRKEIVQTLSGTYETYLIEPDLKKVGGVFEKKKDAKIQLWVTADERRILVKIASKVAMGSFVGELVAIEQGKS